MENRKIYNNNIIMSIILKITNLPIAYESLIYKDQSYSLRFHFWYLNILHLKAHILFYEKLIYF